MCGKFNFINLMKKAFGFPLSSVPGMGEIFFVLFHVSGHLEQFGGVLFVDEEIYYFGVTFKSQILLISRSICDNELKF